jgi:hypothetical protein
MRARFQREARAAARLRPLTELVERLLEKDPARRPQTAEEVGAALDAFLHAPERGSPSRRSLAFSIGAPLCVLALGLAIVLAVSRGDPPAEPPGAAATPAATPPGGGAPSAAELLAAAIALEREAPERGGAIRAAYEEVGTRAPESAAAEEAAHLLAGLEERLEVRLATRSPRSGEPEAELDALRACLRGRVTREPEGRIAFTYEFDAAAELDDFHACGCWRIEEGVAHTPARWGQLTSRVEF